MTITEHKFAKRLADAIAFQAGNHLTVAWQPGGWYCETSAGTFGVGEVRRLSEDNRTPWEAIEAAQERGAAGQALCCHCAYRNPLSLCTEIAKGLPSEFRAGGGEWNGMTCPNYCEWDGGDE